MTGPRIAILSLACRFPEANDVQALWRNVLEGRRAFRPIPDSRLPLGDYDAARVGEADSIPRIPAALLTDWSFSREDYRVPRATYDTADLTHWLALDVAAEAIAAAGGADALPRDRTAVILGDTLTGEFTRAAQIRLRTPYLMRKLGAVLEAHGLAGSDATGMLTDYLQALTADFPDPNEESLAGALANTIAGRIANHFDFHGGAWTVDGACASSLLALADGCGRLTAGDADVAVVGGVDLSLDPFELVGFARAGALARDEMRVFDRRAGGFWPGEGCGVAVLATADAAARTGAEPIAWIRGWGVSTDGAGGLTRPTVNGQSLALTRAWQRAAADPAQAGLFEAHGTGTAVGDPTEIRGLAALVGAGASAIPVGSIKANIGHCKAAAGMAGLIKAACALREGIVPPHVGCDDPHPVFAETGDRLAPAEAREWRGAGLAGVSGFGFGGVNAHVVLQGPAPHPVAVPRAPLPQDAELFVFAETTAEALRHRLDALRARAGSLSFGELADAAASAARQAHPEAPFRAAVVARRPEDLAEALGAVIDAPPPTPVTDAPRIGFLFPGQAAPARPSGGAWARRFPQVRSLLDTLPQGIAEGDVATDAAQPAIVAASLGALRVLSHLGLAAEAAAGHSLGELCALAWAGALDEAACLHLATARGTAMANHGVPGGAMARLRCDALTADRLAAQYGLAVACLNGREETVLAGRADAIDRLVAGTGAEALRVSHAFHSPDMAPAEAPFRAILASTPFHDIAGAVISTVTGAALTRADDLSDILLDQLTHPVRFTQALSALSERTDLLIEIGPGAGLTRLATEAGLTCLPVDSCAPSLQPLLHVLAEAWRRGARFDATALCADRPTRALSETPPALLVNPCGVRNGAESVPELAPAARTDQPAAPVAVDASADTLAVVRAAVAEELGLPVDSVPADARLLDDLHLNSLSVGRIVAAAAARFGMANPAAVMDLSKVSASDIAAYLSELRDLGPAVAPDTERVEGVAPWIAEFETVWQPVDAPMPSVDAPLWRAFGPQEPPAQAELPLADSAAGALVVLGADGANAAQAASQLWERVKAARASGAEHLAVLHHGAGIEGFAGSLVAEGVFHSVKIVDMQAAPDGWADVADLLRAAPRGLSTWRLAAGGGLLRAALDRVGAPAPAGAASFGPDDVALVLGGARGIGAECALRLAEAHGVRLALVGRSPVSDPAVAETLARAQTMGMRAVYRSADATSAQSLKAALDAFAAEGLVPSIALHAAGVNHPARFDDLEAEDLRKALAPKLDGLETMLAALDPARLKLAVGFGSIIGALGLEGEKHYALANGMMAERLSGWGAEAGVRTLAIEWSVWAGAGMGERLGAVERLRQKGVDAIPLDTALARFEALVADPQAAGRRIVTSRFGPPDHVRFTLPALPALRFVETPKVHFPGVELVTDALISTGTDPWLEDHVVDGTPVVPGVMLLEAAAQAALALTGEPATGVREVSFDRAVALSSDSLSLRVAALADDAGQVHVVLRASDDAFASDRARMTVLTGPVAAEPATPSVATDGEWAADALYGALFFNAGRFRRIDRLERVSAFDSRVRITAAGGDPWFGPFLAQHLVLGDPGARDAGLHALQACAPQRRVLPVSVERIVLVDPAAMRATAEARETWSDGDRFCFDIVWRDAAGRAVEVWQGALFQAVSVRPLTALPCWMLPAALERAAASISERRDMRLVLETAGAREERRSRALERLGIPALHRRGDGAPDFGGEDKLSLSHSSRDTLAARGTAALGVDLVENGDPCSAALGPVDRALAEALAAMPDWTAPRAGAAVWAAREALRKVGAAAGGSLRIETAAMQGGVLLRAEGHHVACIGWGASGSAALAIPIATTGMAKRRAVPDGRGAVVQATV